MRYSCLQGQTALQFKLHDLNICPTIFFVIKLNEKIILEVDTLLQLTHLSTLYCLSEVIRQFLSLQFISFTQRFANISPGNMSPGDNHRIAGKVPQVILHEKAQTHGWILKYTNVMDLIELEDGSTEQENHPLYKTKRCQVHEEGWSESRDCPRGKYCAFAHTEQELRPPNPNYCQEYLYILTLNLDINPDDSSTQLELERRFRGPRVRLSKGQAKQDVATECLDFIQRNVSPILSTRKKACVSNKEVKKLVWNCLNLLRNDDDIKEAARSDWLKCLSLLSGKTLAWRPEFASAIRDEFGTFSGFLRSEPKLKALISAADQPKHHVQGQVTQLSDNVTAADKVVFAFLTGEFQSDSASAGPHPSRVVMEQLECVVQVKQGIVGGRTCATLAELKNRLQKVLKALGYVRTVKTKRLAAYLHEYSDVFEFDMSNDEPAADGTTLSVMHSIRLRSSSASYRPVAHIQRYLKKQPPNHTLVQDADDVRVQTLHAQGVDVRQRVSDGSLLSTCKQSNMHIQQCEPAAEVMPVYALSNAESDTCVSADAEVGVARNGKVEVDVTAEEGPDSKSGVGVDMGRIQGTARTGVAELGAENARLCTLVETQQHQIQGLQLRAENDRLSTLVETQQH